MKTKIRLTVKEKISNQIVINKQCKHPSVFSLHCQEILKSNPAQYYYSHHIIQYKPILPSPPFTISQYLQTRSYFLSFEYCPPSSNMVKYVVWVESPQKTLTFVIPQEKDGCQYEGQ